MAPFLLPSFFNINKQKLVTETYELPSLRVEPHKKRKARGSINPLAFLIVILSCLCLPIAQEHPPL